MAAGAKDDESLNRYDPSSTVSRSAYRLYAQRMERVGQSRILLSPPSVTAGDVQGVLEAMESGWLAPVGPDLEAFEAEVAQFIGVESAVGLASGTAALHLALKYVGVGPGDAVLVPSVTFGATAFAVTYLGAEPVFIDVDASWNMDAELASTAISDLRRRGHRVSAAVPVDLYGALADYASLAPLFNEAEVPVVEDAAEALGAVSNLGRAGSFGRAGVLSFNGNKLITTSGGGMLVTNDGDMASKVRFWATQSREDFPWYEHTEIGYNYRLSNILAALGRSQLRRVADVVERRRQIRDWYRARLEGLTGVEMQSDPPWGPSNAWLSVVRFDPATFPDAPERVRLALEESNVESRHVWKPLHLQPVFKHCEAYLSGAAEALFREGLCLPSGSDMTEDDVERVTTIVLATLRR